MRTLGVLVLLLAVPNAATADRLQRCAAAKLKAAAKYASAYYDCYTEAAAQGGEPAPACLVAATELGRAAVAAADLIGPCPGSVDHIVNAICVPALAGGDPRCHAEKYRAAGVKFTRRLGCHRAALRRGRQPRTGCFARGEARFAARFARADRLGTCGGEAGIVEGIVDRCVSTMARAVSCGNGTIDYGEHCEGGSDVCDARACQVKTGECCVTSNGCFQFDGPIEVCLFADGLDVQPGFCTASGCAADVPIPPTQLCCQRPAPTCTSGSAASAGEMRDLAAACASGGGWLVVGSCDTDGHCVAAPQ